MFLQHQQQEADDGGELFDNNAHGGGGDPSYQTSFRDMLAVVNFGDVQLIFRYYNCECECDYHVDKNFFKDFHHCTRWKLDVFKDCKVPRYIHLEDGTAGEIICRETSLTLQYNKMVILNWEGIFESKTYAKKYPNKHANNVVDFGPPKLKQQALHYILRHRPPRLHRPPRCCCCRHRHRRRCRCKKEETNAAATTSTTITTTTTTSTTSTTTTSNCCCCCSRKRKWEETTTAAVDLLMCSEQMMMTTDDK